MPKRPSITTVLHGGTLEFLFKSVQPRGLYHYIGGIKGDPRYAFLTKYKIDNHLFDTAWFTAIPYLQAKPIEVEIPLSIIKSVVARVYDQGREVYYDPAELEAYYLHELSNPTTRVPPSRRTTINANHHNT